MGSAPKLEASMDNKILSNGQNKTVPKVEEKLEKKLETEPLSR